MKKRLLPCLLCLFLLLPVGLPSEAQFGGNTGACGFDFACQGAGCIASPTSLPSILPYDECPRLEDCPYETGGKCGTKSCFVFFRCPCGNPLGIGVCPDLL
jgi:hypothetical protein